MAGKISQTVGLFEQSAERLRPYLKRSGFGYYPHNKPVKRLWLDPDETDPECRVARDEFLRLLRELAVIAEKLGYDSTPFLLVENKLAENCYQPLEDAKRLCRRLAVAVEARGHEEVHVECLVTLQQIAAMVNRSKKTLERRKDRMPMPKVAGGGGKPDEWAWAEIRSWLEKEFERELPERFPADKLRAS